MNLITQGVLSKKRREILLLMEKKEVLRNRTGR
jgi:hypothetical protein